MAITGFFKRILKGVLSRAFWIPLLFLLQIISVFYFAYVLENDFIYVSLASRILNLIIISGILLKDNNPNFKIPWIVLLSVFSLMGTLCFLIMGFVYLPKKYRRKYQSVYDKNTNILPKTLDNEIDDLKIASQSKYIYNSSKFPIYKNSRIKYLKDGEIYYQELLKKLQEAKKYIFLEYFIIANGEMWSTILDILLKKVKEGVDVRVIYDDIGCFKTLYTNYDKYLTSIGIKCVRFNKIKLSVSVVYNNRDHRKIAIVDGKVAFTGGINLADEYINKTKRFGHWKDNGIMIEGEAVSSFVYMFLMTYNVYKKEEGHDRCLEYFASFKEDIACNEFIQPFDDGPYPKTRHYVCNNVYLNMINQATKYVYITTPYLIIDYTMITALTSAAMRGVDVRIITPHIPDKKVVFSVTRYNYRPLIQGGVKIYEYTPGFIHSKMVICDDEVAVVGTSNFDYRSFVHHFECGCYIYNSQEILEMKKDFLETQQLCEIPPKKVYTQKYLITRIYFAILNLFSPLM